jgi:hypothetical protein
MSLIGTVVLIFSYWLLFYSAKSDYFGPTFCHNLANPVANCIDLFNEGKIIFAFILPFFVFLPIGYIIVAYSKDQGIWVCERKWMFFAISAIFFALFFVLVMYLELPLFMYYVIGFILTGCVSTVVVTAWTVFFHNRKHLLSLK